MHDHSIEDDPPSVTNRLSRGMSMLTSRRKEAPISKAGEQNCPAPRPIENATVTGNAGELDARTPGSRAMAN